ncbi:MAG TPA: hypothetical protein VK085_03780 [Pseudogracilibacillus sp.]|nr:hypothetical protein [Pseudogracilibacillus sp.]
MLQRAGRTKAGVATNTFRSDKHLGVSREVSLLVAFPYTLRQVVFGRTNVSAVQGRSRF